MGPPRGGTRGAEQSVATISGMFDRLGARQVSERDLESLLRELNRRRVHGQSVDDYDDYLGSPSTRLAVYGSLAPSEVNHWVIQDIPGTWEIGYVRGELELQGWGATEGFPAMIWIPDGEKIWVQLFTSQALPHYWNRIDEFEGDDYQRILVPVERPGRSVVVANIYEVRGGSENIES